MPSVVWTPTAVQDLQRHREFLAVLSPDVANRTIQSIVKQGESLIQNPRRGPVIEESSGLRKLPLRIGKMDSFFITPSFWMRLSSYGFITDGKTVHADPRDLTQLAPDDRGK
jgi:plasmid stabilization system protein ParE